MAVKFSGSVELEVELLILQDLANQEGNYLESRHM